jgi:hypothetical protein
VKPCSFTTCRSELGGSAAKFRAVGCRRARVGSAWSFFRWNHDPSLVLSKKSRVRQLIVR